MLFLFKKRELVLDCFTSKAHVHDYAPVGRAAGFTPQWWKELPTKGVSMNGFTPSGTLKQCAGFTELYTKGVMLPMWSELAFRVNQDRSIDHVFADNQSHIDYHPEWQRGGFAPEGVFSHAKILTPWLFRCKQDVQWHFGAPIYNQHNPSDYIVCPGVVNFKYLRATNVSLLIPTANTRVFTIPHGAPLAHIVPLSDVKLKVNNILVSDAEYAKLAQNDTRVTFLNSYAATKKIKQGLCPFTR